MKSGNGREPDEGGERMEETRQETIDRLLNEAAELRHKVDHNADLYRRDVRYALDLMGDVSDGEISLEAAIGMFDGAHGSGRAQLESWRMTEDQRGERRDAKTG